MLLLITRVTPGLVDATLVAGAAWPANPLLTTQSPFAATLGPSPSKLPVNTASFNVDDAWNPTDHATWHRGDIGSLPVRSDGLPRVGASVIRTTSSTPYAALVDAPPFRPSSQTVDDPMAEDVRRLF